MEPGLEQSPALREGGLCPLGYEKCVTPVANHPSRLGKGPSAPLPPPLQHRKRKARAGDGASTHPEQGGAQQRLEPCPWVTHGAEALTRPKSPHNSFHYSAQRPRNSPLLMRGRPPKGGREEAGKILNSSTSNQPGSLQGLLPAHSRSKPGTCSTQGCSGSSAAGASMQTPRAPP